MDADGGISKPIDRTSTYCISRLVSTGALLKTSSTLEANLQVKIMTIRAKLNKYYKIHGV